MKNKSLFTLFTGLSVLYAVSCSKENISNAKAQSSSEEQLSNAVAVSICDQFAYADTIFYPEELPDDYVVHPLNVLSGKYGAFPDELDINPRTGNIDITESETGLRYLVWFVPTGSTDTCKKFITVSGINYMDSIYTLKNNASFAVPVYNATPSAAINCTGICEFDDGPDDDDGDGAGDEPRAGQEVIPQGIAMDKSTGAIDLKQSIANGALGVNPASGTFKDFMLNYRISDGSSRALNKIAFRIYYYKSQSQIPARLKRDLAAKQAQILLNQAGNTPQNVVYTINNTLVNKNGKGEVKCRPPYIIVVQN